MNPPEDVFYKKTVELYFAGKILSFRVSQDLFSSFDIDAGTKLLLRTLSNLPDKKINNVLDLGCGYGTIGVALKAEDDRRKIQMVDRDALAIEYSKQNALLNGFSDLQIYGSLGFDDIKDKDFDLIISNIPAKAGEKAISYFLKNAVFLLKPSGIVTVVVVAPLESTVRPILENDPNITILFEKMTPNCCVFHYSFKKQSVELNRNKTGIELGAYERKETDFSYKGIKYRLKTAHTISEFDTLDYQTELVFGYLYSIRQKHLSNLLFVNSGQGHIPVLSVKLFNPKSVVVADRDLLTLRYTALNLAHNGFSSSNTKLCHCVGILENMKESGMVVATLREDEGRKAILALAEQTINNLEKNGVALFAASSTPITRLEENLKGNKTVIIKDRKRYKGQSLLVLEKIV